MDWLESLGLINRVITLSVLLHMNNCDWLYEFTLIGNIFRLRLCVIHQQLNKIQLRNHNDQGVMCFTFTSRYILLKVRSSHQRCSIKKVFSCEFCEFFKNIFFTEHFPETASKKSENESFIQFLPGNEPWNGFNARKDLRSMQSF